MFSKIDTLECALRYFKTASDGFFYIFRMCYDLRSLHTSSSIKTGHLRNLDQNRTAYCYGGLNAASTFESSLCRKYQIVDLYTDAGEKLPQSKYKTFGRGCYSFLSLILYIIIILYNIYLLLFHLLHYFHYYCGIVYTVCSFKYHNTLTYYHFYH